jgi:ABC-2 type transport system ATP-binding protein
VAGAVRVLGASPAENDKVLRRMVFVREDQVYPTQLRICDVMKAAPWFYPNWSAELAESLVEDFGLPPRRMLRKLSRGMRSAVGIVIGLAARAEVTMFDEPYAGLDAVARQIFYDRMLADYAEHPRTVLLSTHLIDEVAGLLERVVVIDRGRVALSAATDDLRGSVTSVNGPAIAVEEFTAGHTVWARRHIASQASAVMLGELGDADRARARALRLTLEPLTLQQVVVHAAGTPARDSRDGADSRERTIA